jgi:hypothetical protein
MSRGTPRLERGAIVVVPLVAVATMALGLRIGASPAVRAAVVYGAPPGAAEERLAWQILTIFDDRGVREAIPMNGVSVIATAKGKEARWEGATNADGVAEVALDLPAVGPGELVHLKVVAEGEKTPLAEGFATWPAVMPDRHAPSERLFAHASKQDGDLWVEVAVYGQRLAPGFPSSVWVHVRDLATDRGVRGARLFAEPDPGLALERDPARENDPARDPSAPIATADDAGWIHLAATAQIHVVALGLRAETPTGVVPPKHGSWYGGLPVAPGGVHVPMPLAIPAGTPHGFQVFVSTVLPRVYAEIDDDVGRVDGAVLPVSSGDFGAHASFDVPALKPGTYWLVTSGEPHGGETLTGSAIAHPFEVEDPQDPDEAARATSRGSRLATLAPPSFTRFVALDGLPGKRHADGGRHRRGLFLAFGSLFVAAALEALLILRGVERARREIARVAAMLDEDQSRLERRFSATSVIIGLLLALLGFALLAALLTWKAS